MLKRKANLWVQESEEAVMSSESEIRKRKIYRARRPSASVPVENQKFKIAARLISIEDENRLLAESKPDNVGKRSENPFRLMNFSSYTSLEPFKEIIQNREENNLKDFLRSRQEKVFKVSVFSAECFYYVDSRAERATCEIIREDEKYFLSIRGGATDEGKIWRNSVCKEVFDESQSFFNIVLDSDIHMKIRFDSISKHLFLRCFAEAKSKSFF